MQVTVNVPTEYMKRRGIHATTQGFPLRVRMSNMDIEQIRKAAELLGVTVATFVRASAMNIADAVVEQESYHGEGNDDGG